MRIFGSWVKHVSDRGSQISSTLGGPYIEPLLPSFQNDNGDIRILRQPGGKRETGCPSTNDNIVKVLQARLVVLRIQIHAERVRGNDGLPEVRCCDDTFTHTHTYIYTERLIANSDPYMLPAARQPLAQAQNV
jgi:hypothetical protein